MTRSKLLHTAVAAAVIGLGVTLAPASDAAAPKKVFVETLTVDGAAPPARFAADADYTFDFTLANDAKSPQAFGSAQIHVPTGFTVSNPTVVANPSNAAINPITDVSGTGAGPLLMTSNGPTGSGVQPGSSVTIEVGVHTASAAACDATWTTQVKQSNDFSGTGNDFTGNSVTTMLVGSDHLAWTTQPSNVQYLTNMSPAPVVAIVDACNKPVARSGVGITVTDNAGKLSAPLAATTGSGGTATLTVNFPTYGFDDVLRATADTSTGIAGCDGQAYCDSSGFHVYQLMQPCPATRSCTGTVSDNTTTSATFNVAAGDTKDTLVADTLGNEPDNATCLATSGRPQDYGATISFDIQTRGKVVTMTLLRAYVNQISNNGTPFMDICLSIPSTQPGFTDKYGNVNVHDGLLADCANTVPVNDPPCINSRKKNAGNEIITFTLDPGDPKSSWF